MRKMETEGKKDIRRIKRAVRTVTGMAFGTYAVKSKRRRLADARRIFAHECRELGMTLGMIGGLLSGLSPGVVWRLLKRYDDYYETDPPFRRAAGRVSELIGKKGD